MHVHEPSNLRSRADLFLRNRVVLGNTPFDALAPYRHLVSVGATHEAFVAAIERALADDDPRRRQARRNSVAAESWDRQAAAVADLLGLE